MKKLEIHQVAEQEVPNVSSSGATLRNEHGLESKNFKHRSGRHMPKIQQHLDQAQVISVSNLIEYNKQFMREVSSIKTCNLTNSKVGTAEAGTQLSASNQDNKLEPFTQDIATSAQSPQFADMVSGFGDIYDFREKQNNTIIVPKDSIKSRKKPDDPKKK